MERLQLKTNRVQIVIDDDPERAITFNPNDVQLRDRIYRLGKTIKSRQSEIEKRIQEFDLLEGEDELGVPLKDIAAHKLMVELAEFISAEIDATFGKGTSEKLYFDGFDFESTSDFMELVSSKLQAVSQNKINQRLSNKTTSKKAMK